LTLEVPPELHGGYSDDAVTSAGSGYRPSPVPGIHAGSADVVRREVVVRLAAGERAHAAVAWRERPRVLHSGARGRSRVRPEHRRRVAADAAGDDRQRRVD